MRTLLLSILLLLANQVTAYSEQEFTLLSIGASKNLNAIFVDVAETAANTNCSSKKILRMPADSLLADKFYAIALTANAQNKSLTIGYEPDDCFANGIEPRVFKIK